MKPYGPKNPPITQIITAYQPNFFADDKSFCLYFECEYQNTIIPTKTKKKVTMKLPKMFPFISPVSSGVK